jgi:hypothetical protein
MMKKSNIKNFLGFGLSIIGLLAFSGNVERTFAQGKDPFARPFVKSTKPPAPKTPVTTTVAVKEPVVKKERPVKVVPPPPMPEKAPTIEERIAYYKRLRETAAMSGQPLPKPTMVMTIDELAVNGVFHNNKGFSAIVEATPIKLSYTVYPGEKFFDGQLVAIEENRLVFRRITKWSNGKTIASEENKTLRMYTNQEQMQGTAPVEQTAKVAEPQTQPQQPVAPTAKDEKKPASPTAMVSPLEQWEKQSKEPKSEPVKDEKSKKDAKSSGGKKMVKVSENKKSTETRTNLAKKPTVKVAKSSN